MRVKDLLDLGDFSTIVSRFFFVLLLSTTSCGGTTNEVQNRETIPTASEEPNHEKAINAEQKATFVIEYVNPVDAVDPKEAFGSYLGQDALWVEQHQLFVNQEFDFAVAMSMPDIGAGIAAKKRQDANKKIGEQLESIPIVNLQEVFEKAFERRQNLRQESFPVTVALYGLLFGDKKARLQSALEVTANAEREETIKRVNRFIYVSEQKALTGNGSWTSDNGAALTEAMRFGTEQLVLLFYEYRRSATELSVGKTEGTRLAKCPIGGNQKITGAVIAKRETRTILKLDKPQKTLLSCDSESLLQ